MTSVATGISPGSAPVEMLSSLDNAPASDCESHPMGEDKIEKSLDTQQVRPSKDVPVSQLLSVKRRREAVLCVPDNPRCAPFNYMLSHLILDDAAGDFGKDGSSPIPSPISMSFGEKFKTLSTTLNARSSIFASLPKSTQESIIAEMHLQKCRSGTVIVAADSVCDRFSVVYSGSISVIKGLGSNSVTDKTDKSNAYCSESSERMSTAVKDEPFESSNVAGYKVCEQGMARDKSGNDLLVLENSNFSEQTGKRVRLSEKSPTNEAKCEIESKELKTTNSSSEAEIACDSDPVTLGPGSLISEGSCVHPQVSRVSLVANGDVYLFTIEGGLFRFLTSSANKSRFHELRAFLTHLTFLIGALQRQLSKNGSTPGSAVNSPLFGPQQGSLSPSVRRSPYKLASTILDNTASGGQAKNNVSGVALGTTRRRRSLSPSNQAALVSVGLASDTETLLKNAPNTILAGIGRTQSPIPGTGSTSPLLTPNLGASSQNEDNVSMGAATPSFRRYKVGRSIQFNALGAESASSSGNCSSHTSPELKAIASNASIMRPHPLPRVPVLFTRDATMSQDRDGSTIPSTCINGTDNSPSLSMNVQNDNLEAVVKPSVPRALTWSNDVSVCDSEELDSGISKKTGANTEMPSQNRLTNAKSGSNCSDDSHVSSNDSLHANALSAQKESQTRQKASNAASSDPSSKTVMVSQQSLDSFIAPMLPKTSLLRLKSVNSSDSQLPLNLHRSMSQQSSEGDTPNFQTNTNLHTPNASRHFSYVQSPRRKGVNSPYQFPGQIQKQTGSSQTSSRDSSTPVTPNPAAHSSVSFQQLFKSEMTKVIEVFVESSQIVRLEMGQTIPENLDCFYIIMKGSVTFPADLVPRSPSQRTQGRQIDGDDSSSAKATYASPSLHASSSALQITLHEGQVFFPRAHRKNQVARSSAPVTSLIIADCDKVFAAMPWLRSEVTERTHQDWINAQNVLSASGSGSGAGSGRMSARDNRNVPSPMPISIFPSRNNQARRTGSLFQREDMDSSKSNE